MANPIPTTYRIIFTWIDPLLALWAAYMNLFDPNMVLRAFIPGAVARVDHEPLLHQAAGTMVAIALLGSTLLRATNDVKLWKIYQGSVWTIDVIGLWSLYTILGGQGRLHPSAWRGEDWGCVGISVLSTLVRSLFVLGVGLRKGDERFKLA